MTTTLSPTTFHTRTVGDVEVFYRAAGSPEKPVVLLLHGFPSSSFGFRNLIPRLAGDFRVIAPDLPGFGSTVAPPRGEYRYTFDSLAETIDGFTEALELERFAIYVFDFGAPVGFRIATRHPERITAIISQNGNAYAEGLTEAARAIESAWDDPTGAHRDSMRFLLTRESTEWMYTEGVPADLRDRIGPDALAHDQANLDRAPEVHLDLLGDYGSNVEAYPRWQEYLRDHRPPLLAVWGENDPLFARAGAEAYRRDVPDARIVLLDTGHFALETHLEEIAGEVTSFLKRVVA